MIESQSHNKPGAAAKISAGDGPVSERAEPAPTSPASWPGRRPMYAEYFGLSEAPFSIAPDPHYLYMSGQHQEALAHLLYGIHSDGGFVLLTGEVGTGKTTVCRCFLEQLPQDCDVAFIINPKLNAKELLLAICEEFCVVRVFRAPPTVKELVDRINSQLLASHRCGRSTILVIDEAQNLSMEVLEQMRLLTNLETDKRKLLQVIMIGQPELREILARPQLRQLAQRITARYHLGPLNRDEVAAYIRHRLAVAGHQGPLFPSWSVNRLYRLTGGIPRIINVLCDRALLGTYVEGKDTVDRTTLLRAAKEVFGVQDHGWKGFAERHRMVVLLTLGFMLVATLAGVGYQRNHSLDWNRRSSGTMVLNPVPAPPAHPATVPRDVPPESVSYPDPITAVRPEARIDWSSVPDSVASGTPDYRALFRRWDLPVAGTGAVMEPCTRALTEGVQCLSGLAESWQEVLGLNRPVVLEVVDEHGRPFVLTVLHVAGDDLVCDVGERLYGMSVNDLAKHWNGQYTLFWKPPPGYEKELRKGDQGPVVAWLSTRLEIASGKSLETPDPMNFDERLLERVKAFQQSVQLVPDGIVGPQTLIRLNTLTGENVPVILADPGERQHVLHPESS